MNLEKIMDLEAQIRATVQKDNIISVNFQYGTSKWPVSGNPCSSVAVYTYNSKTKEFFLLMTVSGTNNVSCLEEILAYVTIHKNEMNSYTVLWSRKGENTPINSSYFYCKNVVELTEKFFAGKDPAGYIIYEIKLNPIS